MIETKQIEKRLDEIVRILALGLQRQAENQTEAIVLLSQAGLEPGRIAELVGTTASSVRATLSQARARAKSNRSA